VAVASTIARQHCAESTRDWPEYCSYVTGTAMVPETIAAHRHRNLEGHVSMDIYQRLKQDHDLQRNLAERIMATSGDSEARRALWHEFEPEAVSHAAAEEETFYSVLIATEDGQEQARHSVAEHQEAADLIEEIGESDMSSGTWIQKFAKLKEALEHHMDEEEQDVFALAKRLLGDDVATRMTGEFDQRKRAERAAA
jgi:hypothetical protein